MSQPTKERLESNQKQIENVISPIVKISKRQLKKSLWQFAEDNKENVDP